MLQRILCWAFTAAYRPWLWNEYRKEYETVVRVKGWRTAVTEIHGSRKCISPCFWWFD